MSDKCHRCLIPALLLLIAAPAALGDRVVDVTPYPVVAGEVAQLAYDPAGRMLDGAGQVYLHYGFNGWSWGVDPDPPMQWNAADAVWEMAVEVPADAEQLDVVFHDGLGNWDNNNGADWHLFVVGRPRWKVDGVRDDDAVLVAESNGHQLYAGVRGTTLYVAVPGAAAGNDHFVFLADSPGFLTSAPWAKSGQVAGWSAFIGNEVENAWAGWGDASGALEVAGGTWLEGTLDLAAEFGAVPDHLHLAFGAYESWDGGALRPALQVPASLDGDGDLEAGEYALVDLDGIALPCHPADLDADCDLDADDFVVCATCLAGADVASCERADYDADLDVDLRDVCKFQLHLSGTIGQTEVVAEDLGPGVMRFYPAGVELNELPPSMSLAIDPVVHGTVPAPRPLEPQYFASGDRHVALISLDDDISLYGTGEICGRLLRNGAVTEAWNTDAYGYGPANPSLYQSHPWVLAVRPDGTAFGVLADTTYRCRMDLMYGILFAAEGPAFPLYVFEGDTPQAVLTRLTDFIGRIELPPLWALGYHQSRYSYAPESAARALADEFRQRDIPCDVIWFDIDYMDGFRIFTFDPWGYPDPQGLNGDLHGMGYHTVWMIDPGVKVEDGYFVDDQGSAGDHWIYNAAGNWYTGEVWPGPCHFPDFTRPATRVWWAGLYADFMAQGIDGVWNDMNEPGIFDGPNHSMPLDCWHRGGGGLPAGPHYQYHNVYGMLMSRATREGIVAANPDKRPFVLSRASFIGGHRHAAMWTGDNLATWEHLYYATPMVLNIGLSGQPFAGPDLGGYGGDATGELFARWMGVGAFMPFCRGHYDGQGVDQEPWSYGADVEAACRTALQRRYRLLPYLYTLFEEAATTGLPVTRPTFFADLTDLSLRGEDVAFLLGADLLVVPNVAPDPWSAPPPALPDGLWRTISLVGEDSSVDWNQPDLLVRGGAILPLGPVMEHTGERPLDPLTLVVSLDETGYAEGWLYEDDGEGYDYLAGDYRRARYAATQSGDLVTVAVAEVEGLRPAPGRQVVIEIVRDHDVVIGSGVDTDAGAIAVIELP